MIRQDKIEEIKKRMLDLNIQESDLEEKFILASKKGGQKVQKSHSSVYIKHLPTGLEIKCQQERERETNRYIARRLLCDLYEEKILKKKTERQSNLDKIKKQKKRRARRAKK